MKQKRISDFGVRIGVLPTGKLNKITDVPGVTVGHCTVRDEKHNTGVTVIMPSEDNIFLNKMTASVYVHNGFGKTAGTLQIEELGTLETPIALTNTLNVGKVSDAVVEYTICRCKEEGTDVVSVNSVVGECNDCRTNDIADRAVSKEHVFSAIGSACADFEEGGVGAGAGTKCYGLKGGIGSASRIVSLGGKDYTVGVIVQSNYGKHEDLRIDGKKISEDDHSSRMGECDVGSIMVILACDVPLTSRQLKRVIKRCSVGIARCGSYIGHGSGEVFIGFSTSNRFSSSDDDIVSISCVKESKLDILFRAAGEATEEAILNSMVCAEELHAFNGTLLKSLKDIL
ncbi:MAG: P1 family peptidase [Ruminococcaceae bacterium]|nr:P1 family peptidase [Oscillospiraceae bacterium]